MDRTFTAKYKLGEEPEDNFVPGTIEERLEMVWDLTRQLASINPDFNVEQPLQRNVTRLIRRKG